MFDSKIGKLGQTVIARSLAEAMEASKETREAICSAFSRYLAGDWGDTAEKDKQRNDRAVEAPGKDRILARYNLARGSVLIITEWDRSNTAIMHFAAESRKESQ